MATGKASELQHNTRTGQNPHGLAEDSEEVTVDINLTDPEDVREKLEAVNITEEETDALLEQAYRINQQLKAQLMLKEQEESKKVKNILPPINSKNIPSNIYNTKQPRAKALQGNPRPSLLMDQRRPHSFNQHPRSRTVPTPPPKSKSFHSGDKKPAWDDRFSYS